MELILQSEVSIVPWSKGRDCMSSHIDRCSETSAATSSCRLLTPGSSTNLHVQLLWCHGVGIQSGIGVLEFQERRSSLGSGVDHLIRTTLLHTPILSGLSIVLPLPLLLTPPFLCVRTPSKYLDVTPPLL